jgi:hypothetical protein
MTATSRHPEHTLPPLLSELEAALSLVQQALSQRDVVQLEQQAALVQRLLADALNEARHPGSPLPQSLRERLARAGAQMAAQRVHLARATAALDRAIDVLMPSELTGLYGQSGRALRQRSSGDFLVG